jgi:hypothetical protein
MKLVVASAPSVVAVAGTLAVALLSAGVIVRPGHTSERRQERQLDHGIQLDSARTCDPASVGS